MDAMKEEKDKHLGLRIDSELHYKLHYISQYEGRSANGEVIYLIRRPLRSLKRNTGRSRSSNDHADIVRKRRKAAVSGFPASALMIISVFKSVILQFYQIENYLIVQR